MYIYRARVVQLARVGRVYDRLEQNHSPEAFHKFIV